MTDRHTVIVAGPVARRQALLDAARAAAHGRQILDIPRAAARLAGGFLTTIDEEALQLALLEVLADRAIELGELDGIRHLPGTPRAVAATLHRAWLAGLDLATHAEISNNARFEALCRIEREVLRRLPPSQLRPGAIAERARQRCGTAARVLGPVTLWAIPDLDPVWRPLLLALAAHVPVRWQLGHFTAPAWVVPSAIQLERGAGCAPDTCRVSCANPRHEALEALRWARALMAEHGVPPQDIGIAAAATAEWDPYIAAIAADANVPVAFGHGRSAMSAREGQTAAALADVLLNGLSQSRLRRLLALVRGQTAVTRDLPATWHQILPRDAPLAEPARWRVCIERVEQWPGGIDFGASLRRVIDLLTRGLAAAAEIGEALLPPAALALWRDALREGPPRALAVTLAGLRVRESLDFGAAILWASAAELAACPRPYVRLLGLTSRGWPRPRAEDALLPSHVIDPLLLDPVPIPERDRRDFATVLRAASRQVVLSRARRDPDGRLLGESPLLRTVDGGVEGYLRRERVPEHAVSEADRLLARPPEFRAQARARSAHACWVDWHRPQLTAHDGLHRARHPAVVEALRRPLSATGLRRLARDPLGFVWRYVLRFEAPAESDVPLTLDSLQTGLLAHRVLELALLALERGGGFAAAGPEALGRAVQDAVARASGEFEALAPVPPRLIWTQLQREIRELAVAALAWREHALDGQVSYAEVPFGVTTDPAAAAPPHELPWDPCREVRIPGSHIRITGKIDRIDLARAGARARVTDYKTGRLPRKPPTVAGGAELQRCLYAYAVRALLGDAVQIESRLLYPRDDAGLLPLPDPDAVMTEIARYLIAARDHALAGRTVIGTESGERADDPLTFALPGNAKDTYFEIKAPAAFATLAPLPLLWELP